MASSCPRSSETAAGAGGRTCRRCRRAPVAAEAGVARRLEVGALDAVDALVGGRLRLQLDERVEVQPEGYCLPPGGPRMMATPYQMEIIQLPEHKRIVMIFEGATHIWREIYMDGRSVPRGRRAQPHLSGLLDRPVGRRHAGGREQGLQREQLVRLLRPSAHRPDVRGRAVDASEQADAALRGHGHGSGAYTRPFTVAWDIPLQRRRASCPSTSARRTTGTEPPRRRLRPANLRTAAAARSAAGGQPGDEVGRCDRDVPTAIVGVCAASCSCRGCGAQFGHPLKGQWSGEWGPKDKPNRLLLDLDWDGKEITGVINPGPNAARR